MNFRNSLFVFVSILTVFVSTSQASNSLPDTDRVNTFDTDLYESVLDPELCAKQLQHIRNEDLGLRLEFMDAGLRLPRGILKGNLMDFGNYPQCLSINKEVEDMTIQGKFCTITVPLDFNLAMQINNAANHNTIPDDLNVISNEEYLKVMREIQQEKEFIMSREGINTELIGRAMPGMSLSFMLSVCVPHACTPLEALGSTILNMTGNIGDMILNEFCRLPNDKPFVAADYVAWIVFSVLGLVIIFSTMYDVHHTFILKKDAKEAKELYSAFCVYRNSCKIVNMTSRPGTLECLDGIRALSVTWIVIGHTFMMAIYFPANPIEVFDWYTSIDAIWMKSAPLAVDTFFLLSGLLVVYTTVYKFTPMKLLKNLHLFYLHRFLRLMPVLAVVILFITSFQHHVGDGAPWGLVAREVESCRAYWWLTLLHLQNFLKPQGGCLAESWYLAIDMQLHILSPIVLFWVFSGAKRPAWIALIGSFAVVFTAATIFIFVSDFSEDGLNEFVYYYVNILTRAPPFFVGMIIGYLLHTFRDKKCALSKVVGCLITLFVLALMALVIYCSHIHLHGDISVTIDKVFMAFNRTAWAACVGWIIFACVNGYAGPINWFLSMSVWKIPSRISYSMYLSHMTIIIYAYHSSAMTPIYFSVRLFMFDFMGFLYLTLFISFFMTAMIDLPFATLTRILLMGGNKTQKKPISNPEDGDTIKS